MVARFFSLKGTVTVVLIFLVSAGGGQESDEVNSDTPEPTMYPDGVNNIPGVADIHYPIYQKIFKTSFSCTGRLAGFYADIEARCQIWHICDVDERMQSFLCTNGTIFSQETRVCEWWYNTNCDANFVRRNYEHNRDLYVTFKEGDFGTTEKYNEQGQRSKVKEGQRSTQQLLQQAPTVPVSRTFENPARSTPPQAPTAASRSAKKLEARVPAPPPVGFRPFEENPQQRSEVNNQRSHVSNQRFDFSNQRPDVSNQRFEQVSNQRPNLSNQQSSFSNQRSDISNQRSDVSNQRPENVARQRDPPSTSTPQRELTREELEQRRQAARAEFYSIPAKIEQENRINQQRLQQEQRFKGFEQPQNQRPAPTVATPVLSSSTQRTYLFTTFPPLVPNQDLDSVGKSPKPETGPKHKFRHSTPRKHNVNFRPSPTEIEEERQIPEESKREPYAAYFDNKIVAQKTLEGQGQMCFPFFMPGYLPTSNEPVEVHPTVQDLLRELPETSSTEAPKVTKRKRRPTKKSLQTAPTVPLPVLNYRPPYPPASPILSTKLDENYTGQKVSTATENYAGQQDSTVTENYTEQKGLKLTEKYTGQKDSKPTPTYTEQKGQKLTENYTGQKVSKLTENYTAQKVSAKATKTKEPRIVVKRRFLFQHPQQQQQQFSGSTEVDYSNKNEFPGNPHLEHPTAESVSKPEHGAQKREDPTAASIFKPEHGPQKRCAVVGTGNVFKVFC